MRPYGNVLLGELLYTLWSSLLQIQSVLIFVFLGGVVLASLYFGGSLVLPDDLGVLTTVESFWIFMAALIGIAGPARLIEEHRLSGTVEQLHLSPVPLAFLCLVRTLIGGLSFLPLLVGGTLVLSLIGGAMPALSGRAVAGYLLMLAGAAGIGYVLAALSLLGARVGSLMGIILLLVLPLSMVDVSHLPVIRLVAWVIPFSAGVAALGDEAAAASSALVPLAVSASLNVALGLVVFRWGERHAREAGTLTRYVF